jgi:hypothetical protein
MKKEMNTNEEFSSFPPLFCGPIQFTSISSDTVGAGRGYVAAKDLEAGVLLLCEEPVIEWEDITSTSEV